MTLPVDLEVDFIDAGPTTSTRKYRLGLEMATDFSNADLVAADALAAMAAVRGLTNDHIVGRMVVNLAYVNDDATVDANNSVYAFNRTVDAGTGVLGEFSIPAWNDDTYDKLPDNRLSAAWVVAANVFAALLHNIKTGAGITVTSAANRGTKRGQRKSGRV